MSPSGSIPGLALQDNQSGGGNDPYGNSAFNAGAPGDFDLNTYINSDYFPEYDGDTDVKFNFDDGGDGLGGNPGDLDVGGVGGDDLSGKSGDANDLFDGGNGDANDDARTQADLAPNDEAPPATAVENEDSSAGRILGSVGTSSGVHSPTVEAADGDDDERYANDTAGQNIDRGSGGGGAGRQPRTQRRSTRIGGRRGRTE